MTSAGDQFQRETKYQRGGMPRTALDWSSQPKLYKEYPDAQKVDLPPAKLLNNCPLHDALQNRRSIRDFADVPISSQALSYLLWASTGISRKEQGYEFRTAPSAGALYPIDTYLCINNVQTISRRVQISSDHKCLYQRILRSDQTKALARHPHLSSNLQRL